MGDTGNQRTLKPAKSSIGFFGVMLWPTHLPLARVLSEHRSCLSKRPQRVCHSEQGQELIPHPSHVQAKAHIPTAALRDAASVCWHDMLQAAVQQHCPMCEQLDDRRQRQHLASRGLKRITALSPASATILLASFKPEPSMNSIQGVSEWKPKLQVCVYLTQLESFMTAIGCTDQAQGNLAGLLLQ